MLDDTESTVSDYTLYHLHRSLAEALKSPDPATQVGAVIITRQGHGIISFGHNAFPEGVEITRARLYDRQTKLKLMVHAEQNAITSAARAGRMTIGCSIYVTSTDETGAVWGGICVQCACQIIQAGIQRVVTYCHKAGSKWANEWLVARNLLAEAGVEYVEVPNV